MALLQLLSSAFAFDEADDAKDALVDGFDHSGKLYQSNVNIADKNLNPLIKSGYRANNLYTSAIGANGQGAQQKYFDNFQNDPGFQEAISLGVDALESSASARGTLNSGGTQKDVTKYVTDTTLNNAFNNRLNRLSNLSQVGMNANNSLGSLRISNTQGKAGTLQGIGQATANKYVNQSNILNQGINQLYDFAGMGL